MLRIIIALLLFCNLAFADDAVVSESVSQIEGLTLECRSCQQLDDKLCQFENLGELQKIECGELIEGLLSVRLSKSDFADEKPSSAELGQF